MTSIKKLLGSSAPIQVLHSGTSFLALFASARLADELSFGHISAYFLLLTIGISLSMQWISLMWLRDADRDADTLYRPAFWLSVLCAAAFSAVWWAYAFFVFGLASFTGALLAASGALAFFVYFAFRRLLLLQGRLVPAARLDFVRALLFAAALGSLHWADVALTLHVYLMVVLAAHLIPLSMLGFDLGLLTRFADQRQLWRDLNDSVLRIFGLHAGDRMNLYSAGMNILFSQSSSIAAPIFISAVGFASLRAYELLLFPVFFVLQTLDPIYLNRFRRMASPAQPAKRWARELSMAALLVATPFALMYALLWVPAGRADFLGLLVPAKYHADRELIHLLLLLTLLMACNGPARWALSVLGMGRPLFIGTLIGFPVSLTALTWLSQASQQAWVALTAKLIYELCVLLICVAALLFRPRAAPAA